MTSLDTNLVLNRLLAIHARSLPMYLVDASPWRQPGSSPAAKTLALIADDHRRVVDQIANLILENGGEVDTGDFPIHFTRFNDLSMDYLVQEVLRRQVQDIVQIERCIEDLALAPHAKAVAQEAHGAALGHLDSLKELTSSASAVHASV